VRTSQGSVQISVRDDGGMDTMHLASAFDPFEGSNTFEHGAGGLGLGLPIARALVSLHRGELELSSAGPGTGTEAIVRLPRVQHSASAPHHDKPQRCEPLSPRRVLVVDDNHDAADMLADAVRLCGGSTVVAYDGPTALERAREQLFDVALIDIGLPQMNGFELAQELRKLKGDSLTIIAVTGFGEPSDRARSREAGIDVHLVKPISILELSRLFSQGGNFDT
jgi:CheY-like chemotaxis protein